jgi:Short C-terminal domain
MLRRRVVGRAVMRTAVVGGTAYAVGHHAATKSAQQQQMDAQQNTQIEDLQQQQQQPAVQQAPPVYQQPAASAPTGMTQEKIDQLKQLGQLRESGILTDTEFEVQKSKLLNS